MDKPLINRAEIIAAQWLQQPAPYEAIVDKIDELVENEPVDIAQIACDCKSAIEALLSEVVALQVENGSKDKEIERLTTELKLWREQANTEHRDKEMYNGMRLKAKAALSRVEAERDR